MTPRFTYIETDDGKYRLLNLEHVKMIDEIGDGHCRITFDSNFTIELHGVGADQFISKLLTESELADEADAVDKVRKRPGKASFTRQRKLRNAGKHGAPAGFRVARREPFFRLMQRRKA